MKRFSKHAIAFAFVASGLSLRLSWQASFLRRPMDRLLGLVADDLFYYLAIGRNLFEGRGASADGIAATNGFHPLFLAFSVPFHAIPDVDLRAKAVLFALLVADALGLWILFRILARQSGLAIAIGVVTILALSKDFAQIPLHGLESSLATLMLALTVQATFSFEKRGVLQPIAAFVLGMLVGACALARTDLVLLALIFPVFVLGWRGWRCFFAFAAGGFLALVPWCAWNLSVFGTILQSSARTHAYREWALVSQEIATSGGSMLARQARSVWGGFRYAVESTAGPVFWLAVLLPCAAWVSRARAIHARVACALVAGILSMAVGYGAFFHFQHWYLHSLAWGLALALGLAAGALRISKGHGRLAGLSLLLSVAWANHRTGSLYYPMMRVNPSVLAAIRSEIPRTEKIGMFSSGYYQYYLPEYQIVNLDGAVNNAIYPALRAKTLDRWVEDAGIRTVVDYEVACRQWFERFGENPLDARWKKLGTVKSSTGAWDVSFYRVSTQGRS